MFCNPAFQTGIPLLSFPISIPISIRQSQHSLLLPLPKVQAESIWLQAACAVVTLQETSKKSQSYISQLPSMQSILLLRTTAAARCLHCSQRRRFHPSASQVSQAQNPAARAQWAQPVADRPCDSHKPEPKTKATKNRTQTSPLRTDKCSYCLLSFLQPDEDATKPNE